MMTNTYLPQLGGVARSVASFTEAFRRGGHRVLIVAPTYADLPAEETDVYRVPAISNFNGSDFSLRLPIPVALSSIFEEFQPDIVHSHHPFLLGDTALRVASLRNIPLVFTHHTMYEQYIHYLSMASDTVKQFALHLPTGYANLCDHVIAPSESIAWVLQERGVETPITPIPTGIDPDRFARGDGQAARKRFGIPRDAFVVGHVGRLAPEKNLVFLARAVASFLQGHRDGHFLLAGAGPAEEDVKTAFQLAGLINRLHLAGPLQAQELADAYHAMDVFGFASKSETQGMVLAEAMTASVPVIALDAPGACDLVQDGRNGRLLPEENESAFAAALQELTDNSRRRALAATARETARAFSLACCASRVLDLYRSLISSQRRRRGEDDGLWDRVLRMLDAEWDIWSARFAAASRAIEDSF